MKAGDMVKHATVKSLGIGLVTHVSSGTCGVKVLWSVNERPTAEISQCLEIISESR